MMNERLQALHQDIAALLEHERTTNPVSYQNFANAAGLPYQSYERIGFEGLRWSVEKRVAEYGLERYFVPGTRVLDIGSNYGFFVNEFALHCGAADGVEPVAELCRIGEMTSGYLGISDRVRFFPCGFESFAADQPYDTVLTLASFFTSDKRQRSSAEAFFGKIRDILAPGGRLFYESTSYQKGPEQPDYSHYPAAQEAVAAIRRLFVNVEEWETQSGPENQRAFVRADKPAV
jgi:SAM-dependent methyltransferase